MGQRQDAVLGFKRTEINGKFMTAYDPAAAMEICARVAEGYLLKQICTLENKLPAAATFQKWCTVYPDVARAYQAARQLSAQAFEEVNLGMAHELSQPGVGLTAVEVRAKEVAMNQFRWSAARRDPGQYGDKATVSVRVPVHITTNLDMGVEATESTPDHPDIYAIDSLPEIVVPEQEVKLLPPPAAKGPARVIPEALRRVEFLPPAEAKPFTPFAGPPKQRRLIQKQTLTPRIPMDAETPLRPRPKPKAKVP